MFSFVTTFDLWVSEAIFLHISPTLTSIASWVSLIGGTKVMIVLAIVIGIAFLVKKKWVEGYCLILSIFSTSVIVFLLKEIFGRVRPDTATTLYTISDPSFPSGHASLSAAFFIALCFVVLPYIQKKAGKRTVVVLCILAPLLIGFSRIVLNVHWASDVIVGWVVGTVLALLSIAVVKYLGKIHKARREKQ